MNQLNQWRIILLVLEGALNLIKNPNNWTRGAFARNTKGNDVIFHSKNACQFCALGALKKISEEIELSHGDTYRRALAMLQKPILKKYNSIVDANDVGGHSVITDAYSSAILNVQENIKILEQFST